MHKYLKVYQGQHDPVQRQLMGTFWDNESGWLYKFESEIVAELGNRSFFKRFAEKDLKPFLPYM